MGATAKKQLLVEILSDVKQMRTGLQTGEGHLDKFDKAVNKLERRMKQAFSAATFAGLAVLGKNLYESGVQSEAMGARYRAVFGANTRALDAWVHAHQQDFGIAEDDLQGYIAQVANMLGPLGLTTDEAGRQATEVLEYASAWSLWSGGEIDALAAADKLTRGMLGPTRGLQELGLNAAAVRDIEEELGGETDELTGMTGSAADAQERWRRIMEQSQPALQVAQETLEGGAGAALDMQTALAELKDAAGELVVQLAPAVELAAKFVSVMTGGSLLDFSHGYEQLTAEQAAALARQNSIHAALERMGLDMRNIERRPNYAAEWAVRLRAEGDPEGAAVFERMATAQMWLAAFTELADQGLLNEDGTIRTLTESAEGLGDALKTGAGYGAKGMEGLVFASSQMKTRMGEAVQATGDAFAALPGLITSHQGDVIAAMKEITDGLRAERDFQNALATLAAAGFTGLVSALEDSPDRDAAMAAAKGFAADLGAAADIEAEIRIQTDLAINASNPLLAVYAARYQAAADAWEKYGEQMRAEFEAGFGTPNPTTTPPAAVVVGDDGDVPMMAEGGTVRRTGLAVVHRGETVVPAKASRAAVGDAGGGDSFTIEVPVYLDKREIARVIAPDVQRELEVLRRSRS